MARVFVGRLKTRLSAHFDLVPEVRDYAECSSLCRMLLDRPEFFDAFVSRRFQVVGAEFSHESLHAVRAHLTPHLVQAFKSYACPNYSAYLSYVRTKRITEFLQLRP